MILRILGPGCRNCARVEERVHAALAALPDIDATVEKVTDVGEIASHGVLATPGLMIDDQLVVAGRVPSVDEVTAWVSHGGR